MNDNWKKLQKEKIDVKRILKEDERFVTNIEKKINNIKASSVKSDPITTPIIKKEKEPNQNIEQRWIPFFQDSDNIYVNEMSSGLTHAVEKMKEFAITGHVTLRKGERSQVATLAAKVL